MVKSEGRARSLTMPRPPNYMRIVDLLINQIRAGVLQPGQQLPKYREMAVTYGVSVSTIQTALRILTDRGYIEGQQGVGVFVVDNPPTK